MAATTSSFEDVTRKMLTKSKELDVHIVKLKKANDELCERADTVLTSLQELVGSVRKPRETCNVCYSRPRQFAVLPCGHAGLCESCSARAQSRGRCFSCRGPIEQVVRIYL